MWFWISFSKKPGEENPKFPGSLPTFTVTVLLLGISLFYLIQLKIILIPFPEIINNYGLKIFSVLFIVRAIGEFSYVGFFKTHKKTKFGQNDTKYYSPLCLLLGLLTLLLDCRLLIG